MRNWKEICAKCLIGAIEPDCEFYGKPRGCNAPTFGEHPQSHNAAALREALSPFPSLCEWLVANAAKLGIGEMVPGLRERCAKARAALAARARNCDVYATAEEALKAHQAAFDDSNFKNGECKLGCPGCDDFPIKCEVRWLFAPAEKGGAE